MTRTIEETNKRLVLEAFDTLFNKRDYQEAERFWSPNYIQHSAHIKPGRDGLFDLIRSSPATLGYEPGTIVAEGDYVIVHGRVHEHWKAEELDRSRYRARGRRTACRTLGRFAGRSNRGRVAKWSADVRDQISQRLTFCNANAVSALGHKQTFRSAIATSALPPKADIERPSRNVC
jgi:predicted SnoaL-like aldol condensation-catalyzing enzyme